MSISAWKMENGVHDIAVPVKPRKHAWSVRSVKTYARSKWPVELPLPAPMRSESTEAIFEKLLATWREETALSSSFTEIIINQSYQSIIGLGTEAVPLLMRELTRGPDHLGWALASITRENPITDEMAGDIIAQTEAWIAWGRLHGYI